MGNKGKSGSLNGISLKGSKVQIGKMGGGMEMGIMGEQVVDVICKGGAEWIKLWT